MPCDLDPTRTAVAPRRTRFVSRLARHLVPRAGATVLLSVVLAVLTGVGHARTCAQELEPNDELHRATPVGDERCMVGALDDDQDVFVWDVSDEDAAVPWVVEIEGIEGQLTRLDLVHATFADDGVGVTAADRMWAFGTSTGRLNRSGPILLPPGPLYLGLSKSGGEGRYVLSFVRQDRSLDRDHRPFDRIDTAQGAFGAYGPVESGVPRELAWELSEADAGLLWGIEGQTSVDGEVTVELTGPDGEEVARGTLGPDAGTAMGFLGLAQGTHTLRISGEVGTGVVRTVVQGRPADGSEVEPNDDRASANPMRLGEPFDGVAERTDWIVVDVPEDRAADAFDLVLEADEVVTLKLHDENGEELLSRRGSSGQVAGLVLGAGISYLTVEGRDAGDYRLVFEPATPPRDGFEVEPNDVRAAASQMEEGATLRGTLATQDTDVMHFEVGEDAGLWRVQAIGDGLSDLAVYDGGGRRLGAVDGSGRLRLDNLVLEPGTVFVEVGGEGDWAVRGLRTGDAPAPPAPQEPAADDASARTDAPLEPAEAASTDPGDPGDAADVEALADPGPPAPPGWIETEPNDRSERSLLLPFGTPRVGTLTDGDRDYYRFSLEHDAYVRIEAMPPQDAQIFFDVSDADRAVAEAPGRPAVFEGWLLAGDYDVALWANVASDGWYQLRATMLDPIAVPVDVEPNHDVRRAAALPADLRLVGTSGTMRDDDVYRLPVFDAPTVLEVRGDLGGANVSLLGDADVDRADDMLLRATLAAGAETHLRLRGWGAYDLQLAFDREPDPRQLRAPPGDSGLAVTATVDASEVAAYWGAHQVVRGELRIASEAGGSREVRLEAYASRQPIEVNVPASVRVEAGGNATVPFEIVLPDDLRDDQPLRVTLGARSDDGVATTTVELAPICEAAPVAPAGRPRVPAALAGHHNVAWAPFGATVIDSDDGNDEYLNDGWTSPRRGAARASGDAFVLDLPGDEPIELSGTLLHPQSRAVHTQLRRFRIETSLDGESWETVLEDSLDAARVEQGFVFDAPVRARYARLVAIDDQDGRARSWIWLGEWKLLSGDWRPSEPIDLAAQRFGGVQVSSDPLVGNNAVLPDVDRDASVDGRTVPEAMFTVGFHHGRAARIDRLAWVASDRGDAETGFREVTVQASLEGPIGPWTEVGTWSLDLAHEERLEMELDAPIWARYLRFTASGHDPADSSVYLPAAVHVYEARSGDGYRSALGAWGHNRPYGPYEAVAADRDGPPLVRVDDDGSDDVRDGARPIGDGDVASGAVLVAEDEDWWRIDVPDGSNVIELRLDADPGVVRYELQDADGEPVVHDAAQGEDGLRLTAFVDPGAYYLHLDEPKRSVVFAWDSSGSMGPFLPITNASVAAFARDLDPEREAAQLLAFASPEPKWLLPWWSGDPAYVGRHRAAFDPASVSSSNAELAMLAAVQALGDREGTRAILLITDHESGGYGLSGDLWRAIEEVRPRVFTFEVSSGGSGITQDRMQAYAAANRGVYDYARNVGDFEAGFRRASCHLRRPKPYTLHVAVRYQEPPGPGALSVARGADAELPGVEVIFDASGSMGSLLSDGTSRIDAARQVLSELVGEILPEGTPFALRAFGHITPQSCESRLEIPLEPLNRDGAFAAIREIQPKLLSQTPIADALSQVAGDLDAAEGSTVVLITDGEESCGGDPAAALDALRDQGVEVNLSIVTLGVESDEVRAGFEALAERASGSYAAADDTSALRTEIEQALYPPFEVLGPGGDVVARGRVGSGSVELPMGVYTVRVPGAPPTLIRDVRVPGDGSVSVTAP